MSPRAGHPRKVLYLNPPGGTLSRYSGRLCQRGAFFTLPVYERIRILLVRVYERVGKSVISVSERIKKD